MSQNTPENSDPKEIFLKDYTPVEFSIPKVDLEFDIFDGHTIVKNISEFRFSEPRGESRGEKNLQLNGTGLELLSVKINGAEISESEYEISEEFLTLKNVPENFTLETIVKIFPEKNKQLMGLYMSDGIYCTQNEPEGFRNITYHFDRPDVMSLYTTTIIADQKKFPILLSNGNNIDSGEMKSPHPNPLPEGEGAKRHFATWEDPFKKPCYLFALVAGNLVITEDSFTTMSGREIPLQIFTDSKNQKRVDHAMKSLKKAMKWDEERFGREYDLDIFMIVAVDNFNSGAMENKGLNIFNSSAILCDQKSATDRDFQFIEAVVAHEYFHNWTGNRITCRDWFQLTLKEGLTVFRDAEFSADMGDATIKRIDDASYMREGQFAEDAGPMAHPIQPQSFIQIENFYTQTVYEKGSEVIRMLQTLYGRDNFRKALDFYFETFDGQAVTIHEFLYSFEKTLNIDLTQFKNSWYFQAGTPEIKISDSYDPEKNEYSITVEQKNPVAEKTSDIERSRDGSTYTNYHFPLNYGLLDKNSGAEISAGMLEITKKSETFMFPDITKKPLISLLRNFSAPVKIEYEYTLEEDIFLFQHDTDLFNKYESGQRVARRMIQKIMTGDDKDFDFVEEKIESVLTAYSEIIGNPEISDGIKAECISLPGLFSILGDSEEYNYHNAYLARKMFKEMIATSLQENFLELFEEISDDLKSQKFSTEPEQIYARKLKNSCLGYLSFSQLEEKTDLIFEQYKGSNNMTDRLFALSLLAKEKDDNFYKITALDTFKKDWGDDNLVINKWISVQASTIPEKFLESEEENAEEIDAKISGQFLEMIQSIEKEEFFDIKNPNKIRRLLGAFGHNVVMFHALDEKGESPAYEYITQKILEIDQFNNKASSGLAHVFDEYSKMPPENKKLIKLQLQKILNFIPSTPLGEHKISDALFEVVSKILKSGE